MKRLIVIALALAVVSPALAQQLISIPTGITSTQIDFGLQPVSNDPSSAKFTEYRDVPDGAVLPFFRVLGDEGLRYDIVGQNVKQDDSRYRVALGFSKLRVTLDYNQIPHRFGNNGFTLFQDVAPGVLAIDNAIQTHCQTEVERQWTTNKAGINYAFLNGVIQPHLSTAESIDLGLIRKRASLEVRMPPGTPYDLRLSYFQENRNGNRAFGTSFGFGDAVEGPEPIDYRTSEVTASAEIPFKLGLLRGAVRYNEFDNSNPSLLFENPWRITDATDARAYTAPGSNSIAGAAAGRISLAPPNRSLTGSFGGMVKLPASSRLTADLSFSQWRQNENFIAYTTNTAIVTPVNAVDRSILPAVSADGAIDVMTALFSFNSRPTKNLTITARYKLYDMNNKSPRIEFPGYVRFDAVWEDVPRISVPFAFDTNRADVTVAYDLGDLTLEGGYRYETWNREFRETRETKEGVWRGAADWKLATFALLRTSYEFGSRDLDHYDPAAADASFVEPEAPNNIPTLRRFDQAAKDISRISALLQLTPRDDLMFSLNYFGNEDDYNKSEHGLLNRKSQSWTAEGDWSPSDRWSVNAFYTRESLESLQRDRQSGSTVSTDPRNDWTAHITDDVDSIGLGSTWNAVPDKLDVTLFGRYQLVNGNNDLDSPPGGTPDFAVDIAQFDDKKLWTTSAEVTYHVNPTWSFAVGGWVEKYWVRDAATTGLLNYMPGTLFLAADNGDYRGNAFYIRTTYRR